MEEATGLEESCGPWKTPATDVGDACSGGKPLTVACDS